MIRIAYGARIFLRTLALACLFTACTAFAQNPIWTSNWTVNGPPTFRVGAGSPMFAASAGGDIVLAAPAPSQADYQIMRVGLNGDLRWVINLGGNDDAVDGSINGIFADGDGSAIVAFGGPFPGYVAKISTNGSLAWSRRIPETSLLASAAGPVIVAGCDWVDFAPVSVSAVDRDTGAILWQRLFRNASNNSQCQLGDIVRDAAGNVYLTLIEKQYLNNSTATSTRAVKLDPGGQAAWTLVASETGSAWPIGGDADRFFVRTSSGVRAFASTDGSALWTNPIVATQAGAVVAQDGTVEPVIESSQTSIMRLAGDTGQARWSVPQSALHVVDGSVVLAGTTRLDAATGEPLWTAALPGADGLGNPVSDFVFEPMDASTLVAGARTSSFGAAAPFVLPIDASTGAPGVPLSVPPTAQGVGNTFSDGWGYSATDDSGHLLSVAVAQGILGPEIRLRQQDAGNGSVLWDVSEPALLLPPLMVWGYTPSQPSLVWTDDAVIVASAENYSSGVGGYSGVAWVAAFSRTSGERLWATEFADPYQQATAIAMPVIADDGNIFLVTSASFSVLQPPNPFPNSYARISAYKLASSDGHALWRRDGAGAPYCASYCAYTPVVARVASDLVVGGPFESEPAVSTLVRLAGNDGATIWTSSIYPPYGVNDVYPSDDANLIATGSGWAKLDAANGNVLWQHSWGGDPSCQSNQCSLNDGPIFPGGDVVQFGQAHFTPWLVRLRGDGSGVVDSWQPESVVPGMRSYIGLVVRDSAGQIWGRLGRYLQSPSLGLTFVAKFDPETGAFTRQQAIGNFYGDPFVETNSPQLIGAPEDNRLFVNTFSVNQPQPATLGDALLDTTVVANGDLSAAITLDTSGARPGQDVIFHFTAMYTGDQSVSGGRLIARLPWAGDPADVACNTKGAGNCVFFAEGGTVQASFDIQPDGSVDVTGKIRVLESTATSPAFGMIVFAPPGLNETETRNNLSTLVIDQSIFFNSFE